MKNHQLTKSFFLLLVTLLLSINLISGEITYTKTKSGNSINTGMNLSLEDSDKACMISSPACIFQLHKTQFLAKLEYEDKLNEVRGAWSMTVNYDIKFTYDDNTTHTITGQSLVINYDPVTNYTDIDYNKYISTFTGKHYIEAELINVTVVKPSAGAADVHLSLEYTPTKYYPIDDDAITMVRYNYTTGYDKTKNELQLYWNTLPGAESYDLEWLFIDCGSDLAFSESYDYDFSNATRVNVSQSHYAISLAYPNGLLIFRVRGRTPYITTTNELYGEGQWSTGTTGTLDATTSHKYGQQQGTASANTYINAFRYDGMDRAKNWQYSASFAEDGKRKEVVAYYDGAMYNRQSVTLSNSTDKAIIGQTIYDFTGRAAINVMPAPLTSTGIHYYDNRPSADVSNHPQADLVYQSTLDNLSMNKDATPKPYSYKDFDVITTPGVTVPIPDRMDASASTGAANYYSPNTTGTGEFKDYLPDAKELPFTRTIFTADGTNRVIRQSGVGETHQIDGKDTRYFYTTPNTQEELDRLFGNEVGAVINYKKNVVLDPNGQASVSYIDGKGRTIATALLAGEEGRLLDINTRPVATPTITADLTDFNSITGKDKLISAKPIFITSAGDHQFKYELPDVLFDDCGPTACHYKLTIYIKNEATGELVQLVHDGGPGSIVNDTLYAGISIATVPQIEFTATDLAFGNYMVVKELAIDHDLLDTEVANFLADNAWNTDNESPCYEFITPKEIDNCCEYNCEQQYIRIDVATQNKLVYDDNGNHIGTILYADYSTTNPIPFATVTNTLSSFESPYTNDDWKVIRDKIMDCKEECSSDEISSCENKYNTLKREMSPGGQYFDNLPDPINYNDYLNSITVPSVFDPSTVSGGTENSWFSVRTNWNDDWGHITVKEHPEYCIYEKFCCVQTSDLPATLGDLIFTSVAVDYTQSGGPLQQNGAKGGFNYLVTTACPLGQAAGDETDPTLTQLLSEIDNVNWRTDLTTAEKDVIKQGLNFKAINYLVLKDPNCSSLVESTVGSGVDNDGFKIHYPIIDLTAPTSTTDPTVVSNQITICQSTCQGSVQSWKNQFKCFDALSAADQVSFETALLGICMSSCNDPGILPNDTCISCATAPNLVHFTVQGNTSTPVTYTATNFTEVLNRFRSHTDYNNMFDPLCPTPAYPAPEEDCLCNNIFDFAVANTTFQYAQLPHSFPDFLSAGFDLEAILLILTGSPLSSKYSDAYTDCMDKKVVAPESVPEILRCDEITLDITPEAIDVTCVKSVNYQNLYNAKQAFNTFLQGKAQQWKSDYIDTCMARAKREEKFNFDYLLDEYHYTLYFYDQADNLIKTVPPEGIYQQENGVVSFDASANIDIKASDNYRKGATSANFEYPYYAMFTNYKYNSLNQLIEQSTPDGGTSIFFYDPLGRLIASQNAEQGTRKAYSFTEFDNLGRIKKVGELINNTPLTDAIARNLPNNPTYLTWLAGAITGGTTQIVETFYDEIPTTTLISPIPQNNTRNRIVAVAYNKDGNTSYESASFYDYDINGNVQVLAQQNKDVANLALGTQTKTMTYDYDLVSGNVNQVAYQAGEKDEFYHKYEYDADNRLTVAYTSRNGIIWEKESKNLYYEHGPLARTEIGDKQVQAQDYAYTIQGWLKTINSSMGEFINDLGKDGKTLISNLNQHFARDAYGFSLHYYQNDYTSVNTVATSGTIAGINNSDFNSKSPDLYNGNISKMIVGLTKNDETKEKVSGSAYHYDQLNRIRKYHSFINPSNDQARIDNDFTNVTTTGNFYNSTYEYDGNGNITYLKRNGGIGASVDMDEFTYIYELNPKVMDGGLVTVRGDNKLYQVTDTKADGNYSADLDGQGVDNYRYDAIGRLIYDREAEIEDPTTPGNPAIFWNVANKITKILKKNGNVITFEYDPMGNRITKSVKTTSGTTTYYYVRDAQGNVMATYKNIPTTGGTLGSGNYLTLTDLHIYGSSRLGTKDENDLFISASGSSSAPSTIFDNTFRTLGTRRYELSNHLGNVLEVIQDRKFAKDDNADNIADYYQASVISYSDYYPFGMLMPNRYTGNSEYKYGFQGQEMDDEIRGSKGTSVNYKYRMHDARIGRFFAVDPLAHDFPWNSSYAFSENSVIAFIELEGLERYYAANGTYLGKVGNSDQIRIVNANQVTQAKKYIRKINMGQDKDLGKSSSLYFTMSQQFHVASSDAQAKVAASIYKKLGSPYKLKSMNTTFDNVGTAAHTDAPSEFTIYPQLSRNGEFLNDNFYNQLNVWYHEEQHSQSMRNTGNDLNNSWDHFDIAIKQTKHWTYKHTTSEFKGYTAGISRGYLDGQRRYLNNQLLVASGKKNGKSTKENMLEMYNSKDFQDAYKLYKKNIKTHNKTHGDNEKATDYKSFINNSSNGK